jgi:hypothetical protein
MRVYPWAQRDNPPETKFVNLSGLKINTIHANNFEFYEEINAVIQKEPGDALPAELVGTLAAIGIKKGQPFAPDDGCARSSPTRSRSATPPRGRSFSPSGTSAVSITRTVSGRPTSSAAVPSSTTTASGCSIPVSCSTTTPPASRRPWRPLPSARDRSTATPNAMPTATISMAARPTASRCRRRSPSTTSGPSWCMTTRPARCWKPTRSLQASTATAPISSPTRTGPTPSGSAPRRRKARKATGSRPCRARAGTR